MAEALRTTGKQKQSLAEGVDKELTCAICLSRYDHPKILPCLHIYCKGCLEDMVKKSRDNESVTCPQCKVVHEIPAKGVDGFTTFFTINNLLELLHIHESSEETSMGSIKCTSGLDENPATARCLTCSDYLCESCCRIHQKQKVTKNHVVKTLEEIKRSDKTTGARSLHKRWHCPEHEDELLKLYCKTCKKVICLYCALVTHKGHEYAVVREVRVEIQKRLEEQIFKVSAKEIEFQNHQKYLENLLKISGEAAKSSKMMVNKTMDEMIEAFEARRAQLLNEIEMVHESEVKQITAESDSLAISLLRLSDSVRFTQQLLDNGDDVEVTSVGDQTEQTLTSLTKLAWNTSMHKPSLLHPEFESMKKNITKFGRIVHTVQPSDIILSNVPAEVSVGKECSFHVHLSKEVSEKGYEGIVEVAVSHQSTCVAAPAEVITNDFNSWTISFTPDEAGKHEVSVKIDDSVPVVCVVNVNEENCVNVEIEEYGLARLFSEQKSFGSMKKEVNNLYFPEFVPKEKTEDDEDDSEDDNDDDFKPSPVNWWSIRRKPESKPVVYESPDSRWRRKLHDGHKVPFVEHKKPRSKTYGLSWWN